jgi:hypothetical protein
VLVERAQRAGLRVYRKDVIAALILASTVDADELVKLILRYRTANAADAEVKEEPDANVLELHRQKPGRRPRKT